MTVAEFRDRLSEEPVILLPFGSQEEQGPHAPMGDYVLTDAIALKAAELSGAISAPCVPFGYAEFFRPFPGGVQFRASTFCAVVEDFVGAFLDHGVERLIVLNGHSTNAALIDQVLRKIRRERGVAVPTINLWRAIPDSLWRDLHGENAGKARGHGGDPITSVYAYLKPDAMRPDLAKPSVRGNAFGLPIAGTAGVTFEEMPVQLPVDADEVNADGMLGGDPELSSPEIGMAIFDHLTTYCARFIEHFRTCDPRDIDKAPPP
ncbi:creatininase family protein [Pseudoruegeria sp. HB172150]|uniref:creatininase family protein n=1 Tax=Pseudoruegeria sp. HB172150 TaxID=2721164 RepID=UPI0015551C0F|nr:creatininase family protein [Pseudoruegeria sp. HB172150]